MVVEEIVLVAVEEHVQMDVVEIAKVDVILDVLALVEMLAHLVVREDVNLNALLNVLLHVQELVLGNAMDLHLSLVK